MVIASALAPFLLLRTYLTIGCITHNIQILETKTDKHALSLIAFLIPFIRIFSTAKIFIQHPLYTISHIPSNFYLNNFVIDLRFSPQLVPGDDEINLLLPTLGLYNNSYTIISNSLRSIRFLAYLIWLGGLTQFKEHRRQTFQFYGRMFKAMASILIVQPILIVFAFSLRFSVKSTAIFWLPLLWVMYQSRPGVNVLDRIEIMIREPRFKLMLFYSSTTAVGFIVKLALLFRIWRFSDLSWLGPVGEAATRLTAPADLPLWQLTSACNAVLVWVFFFRGSRHVLAKNTKEALSDTRIRWEYVGFQAVRTTLALYVIACTFYIMATTAWHTNWPSIHVILFPWSSN